MAEAYLTRHDGTETLIRSDIPDEVTAQEIERAMKIAYAYGRDDECELLTNMVVKRAHHKLN